MGGVKVRTQGEDGESSDLCTIDPRPTSSSEGSAGGDAKASSSVFTVSTINNCTSHTNSIKNIFASSLLASRELGFLSLCSQGVSDLFSILKLFVKET